MRLPGARAVAQRHPAVTGSLGHRIAMEHTLRQLFHWNEALLLYVASSWLTVPQTMSEAPL